jgi:hypothetical protein
MKKTWLTTTILSLCLGFAAVGCGDDEDEDKDVMIKAPGVNVEAGELKQGGATAGRAAVSGEAK